MRNLLSVLISGFVFCGTALPQEASPCPKIGVSVVPETGVQPGDVLTFAADVGGYPEKAGYSWSVTHGSIIEGQGTQIIKVSTAGMLDTAVKATAEVIGFPNGCDNKASKVGRVIHVAPPLRIDEYEKISFAQEKKRLNAAVAKFAEIKSPEIVFIFYIRKKDNIKDFENRKARIERLLTEAHKIPKDKIRFILGRRGDINKTRIYLKPEDID